MSLSSPEHSRSARNERASVPRTREEFLAWIDFKELNSMFAELQRKSGIPEEKQRILRKEDIRFEEFHSLLGPFLQKRRGRYDGDKLDLMWVYQSDRGMLDKRYRSEGAFTLLLLKVLLHESMHFLGYHFPQKGKFSDSAASTITTGLSEYVWDDVSRYESKRTSLDEAMTDKLAADLFIEYVRRKGLGSLAEEESMRAIGTSAYMSEKYVLEGLFDTLADVLEVSPDDIYRAFTRLYLSGEISFIDLRILLVEMLGDEVLVAKLEGDWKRAYRWDNKKGRLVPRKGHIPVRGAVLERLKNATSKRRIENLLKLS